MTTIDDISDLVRVLRERPDWLAAVRNLVLGEDLLTWPQQMAQYAKFTEENLKLVSERIDQTNARVDRLSEQLTQFVKATDENFQLVNQRVDRLSEQLTQFVKATDENFRLANRRFNRLEGSVGNLEGAEYERGVRTRIMVRMMSNLGMASPSIEMHQDGLISPEINRLYALGMNSDVVTRAQMADLQETDLIISSEESRYAVVEISVSADHDDVERASRRADTLSLLAGASVRPVVATAYMHDSLYALTAAQGVTTLIIPNRRKKVTFDMELE